jgi:hypothetical protein
MRNCLDKGADRSEVRGVADNIFVGDLETHDTLVIYSKFLTLPKSLAD